MEFEAIGGFEEARKTRESESRRITEDTEHIVRCGLLYLGKLCTHYMYIVIPECICACTYPVLKVDTFLVSI